MITRVRSPKVSANIEEETITAWFKKEGDTLHKGEALAEITTDKTAVEMEAPRTGVLRRILVPAKSTVPVGYVIALIGGKNDPLPDVEDENRRLMDQHRAATTGRGGGARSKRRSGRTRVRATPAARRLARELEVDLAALQSQRGVEVVSEEMVREAAQQA